MKTEIDILSDREVEIWDYAEFQNGKMDFVTEKQHIKQLLSYQIGKVILEIEMTKQSLLQKGLLRRLKSYYEITIFSAKKTYPATKDAHRKTSDDEITILRVLPGFHPSLSP